MPVDEVDGFFPPRMPSEHFIKDNENPNNILISEEEYISKYKNGQIPDCCVSPYIFEKLKFKQKEEQTNLEQNENQPEIVNVNEENKNKNNILNQKGNINKLNQEENLKLKSIMIQKQKEKERLYKFINYNWNYDEELSQPISQIINCNKLNNITNDINKFGNKRKNFFSNISSFK